MVFGPLFGVGSSERERVENMLRAQMEGRGPSVALQRQQTATNANLAQSLANSTAAGAMAPAASQRSAALALGQLQGATNAAAMQQRAAEQMQATQAFNAFQADKEARERGALGTLLNLGATVGGFLAPGLAPAVGATTSALGAVNAATPAPVPASLAMQAAGPAPARPMLGQQLDSLGFPDRPLTPEEEAELLRRAAFRVGGL